MDKPITLDKEVVDILVKMIQDKYTNDNLDSINENNLKDLTEKNLYNMFINSPNISKEKICYLWKLFTSNEVNNDVKILFYDFI